MVRRYMPSHYGMTLYTVHGYYPQNVCLWLLVPAAPARGLPELGSVLRTTYQRDHLRKSGITQAQIPRRWIPPVQSRRVCPVQRVAQHVAIGTPRRFHHRIPGQELRSGGVVVASTEVDGA